MADYSVAKYAAKRLLSAVPVIIGVILLTFVIIHVAPLNAAQVLAGDLATPQYVHQLTIQLGLNKPIYVQFFIYLYRLAQGNFGESFAFGGPVLDVILSRLPATLILMSLALAISSSLGVVLGVISARKPHSAVDNAVSLTSSLGYAMPVFWLGQLLIILFALDLGIFPVEGFVSARAPGHGIAYVGDVLWHAILPAVSLASFYVAIITRLTRASMLEVLRLDFITTAFSKGLDDRVVLYRHALRNALLPVVTIVGVNMGTLISGSVLVESVFGWPGVGTLMLNAINARDTPVVTGLFVIVSVFVIFVNLLVDVLYFYIDPRIRKR